MSPSVAVMTNISPDHLNTYSSMDEYAEAKANIFRHQSSQSSNDLAIFNYDNPWTRRFGLEAPAQATYFTSVALNGSFPRTALNVSRSPGADASEHVGHEYAEVPMDVEPFIFDGTPLAGRHNRENILLATTTARLLGVPDEIITRVVGDFQGVPYRLELVRELGGVRFINDSASTTPVAGRVGLEAFDAPIVLVVGGNTKHLPLENWPARIVERCRNVVLLAGSGTDELHPALQDEVRRQGVSNPVRGVFTDFAKAMSVAIGLTRPGDVLLFSPGFTSFGMFLNEFDRGDRFVEYVKALV
jgi:UDP-N-acetylmuramoylalanine--D-glutamate ligase